METAVTGLDYQGRGVAREDGRVVFIEGALPNETVEYEQTGGKKRFLEGRVTRVIVSSPARVAPECPVFEACGGCALQHMDFQAEMEAKNALWQEQLSRLGGVAPEEMLAPIAGSPKRYRSRARLSVQYGTGLPAVGFRARQSHDTVAIDDCLVLTKNLAHVLPSLPALLAKLPKVKGLSLHEGEAVCALELETAGKGLDSAVLKEWAAAQPAAWQVWADGQCLIGAPEDLYYDLPDFAVRIGFAPADFTQVNTAVNRQLVRQAVEWIAPQGKQVVDFFAGLGNFSLPFAREGAGVLAIEGVQAMVARAAQAAKANGLSDKVQNRRADLFTINTGDLRRWQKADAWFLDPPRAGAQALAAAAGKFGPKTLIYVSCDAGSFARDAKLLTAGGYRLKKARTANMFVRTAHIESIALFKKEK